MWKKKGDSKSEKQTDVMAAEIQVDGGKPLDGGINRKKGEGWIEG